MLHLKHEAAAKAKAHEAAGRAAQEVSLLRARNGALLRRAGARDQVIVELKEGAKILEDQLRLMDEKYMELRTKLDFTRQSTVACPRALLPRSRCHYCRCHHCHWLYCWSYPPPVSIF